MRPETRKTRDAWIALRCRLGEPAGFEALVAELERPLLYYLSKFVGDENTALDVLQEVWIKVFRTVHRLRDPEALRAWVYRVARGTALNLVRGRASRERAEAGAAEEAVAGGEEPAFDGEDAEALHAALDGLKEEHREVLVLHFLEDLSVAEIGLVVGVAEGTVKSRIHHAKKALRRLLEKRP